MNRRCWSLPLGCIKTAWKRFVLKWHHKELNVAKERIESGREFQIVGTAARKERERRIRLVRGTSKKLEIEDDLRTREGL